MLAMAIPMPDSGHSDTRPRPDSIWGGLGVATFVAAMVLAWRPSVDTAGATVLTMLPWTLLPLGATALGSRRTPVRAVALALFLIVWAALLFFDDRWSVLSFAVYLLCFTFDGRRPSVGIALAALATAVWIGAWARSDNPLWVVLLPGMVFIVAATLALALHRAGRTAAEQAALAAELRATQDELARSERRRGVLEERARMGGEIHDTLAQGFTSIVLLARTARRKGDADTALAAIEEAAEEYLHEARRIVAATQPAELQERSLHDALARHVETELSAGTSTTFQVIGTPLALTGDVEVVLLRAAQEALRNVRRHAEATTVNVTLSYLDGAVALDVRDDGVGFTHGEVDDRGALTGGQGLLAIDRRAATLSGALTIESAPGRGSVVSVHLPTEQA